MVLSKKKKAQDCNIQKHIKILYKLGLKKKEPKLYISINQSDEYVYFFRLVQELLLLSDSLFIIMAINLLSVVGR